MTILTQAEKEAAEAIRFERASDRWPDYTLERRGDSDVFTVTGGKRPYTTTAHSCDCPDATHRGLRCFHQQMVEARLLADGEVHREARRKSAMAFRSLWG